MILSNDDIKDCFKNEYRLIYVIDKYCIKITDNNGGNIAEIEIYNELNNYCKSNMFYDNILKIHNDGMIKDFSRDIVLKIGNNDYNISNSIIDGDMIKLYNDTKEDYDDLFKSEHFLQYFVTEYDENYCIPKNDKLIIESYKVEPLRLHGLIERVYKLLIYLNTTLGFIHWDLHLKNILVNVNNLVDFKIFDFDLSQTNLVDNNEAFERYWEDGIDIKKIIENKIEGNAPYKIKKQFFGLAFDIIFFYIECVSNFEVSIESRYIKDDKIRGIVEVLNGFIVTNDTMVVMLMQTPKLANCLFGILAM